MHFFAFWKQTFFDRKDEKYWLTFDWRFSTLSQSEIRVHWWTHNSKNPTNLGRREFNSTLHQSSHGFSTRVHGFATKTKALACEIPPATLAKSKPVHSRYSRLSQAWRTAKPIRIISAVSNWSRRRTSHEFIHWIRFGSWEVLRLNRAYICRSICNELFLRKKWKKGPECVR